MGRKLAENHSSGKSTQYAQLHLVLIISTKFHQNLTSGIGGVIRTNFVTDGQTARRTDGQTDRQYKINMSPTPLRGGRHNSRI